MIAIIEYNAGNISSVQNALTRLGYESILTRDHKLIQASPKVIFPGVGEAASAMSSLKEHGLDLLIPALKQPVLGICLGLQLMCRHTEEGDTPSLGIFNTEVRKFPDSERVPHMGWNTFKHFKGPLFEKIDENEDVYYVHSYYAEKCHETVAECNYILPFSAALQKGNFLATQFHPEKSAEIGDQILKNFLEL